MKGQGDSRGGKGAGVYLIVDDGGDGVREVFDEAKLFA